MTTSTLERTEGLATLNKAIASIKDTIEEAGGIFNIHKQVRQRKEKRVKRRAPGMYPVLRHTILLWYSHKVEKKSSQPASRKISMLQQGEKHHFIILIVTIPH